MTMLVHPDHPSWNAAAEEGASLVDIATARGSRWTLLVMAVCAIRAGLFALNCLWRALVGASAPDEDA